MTWQDDAACAGTDDPEAFFATNPAVALRVCRDCPVTAECTTWAREQPWPGFTGVAGGHVWVKGQPQAPAQPRRRRRRAAPDTEATP